MCQEVSPRHRDTLLQPWTWSLETSCDSIRGECLATPIDVSQGPLAPLTVHAGSHRHSHRLHNGCRQGPKRSGSLCHSGGKNQESRRARKTNHPTTLESSLGNHVWPTSVTPVYPSHPSLSTIQKAPSVSAGGEAMHGPGDILYLDGGRSAVVSGTGSCTSTTQTTGSDGRLVSRASRLHA